MFIIRLPLRVLGLSNAGSGSIAWCSTAVTSTCPTRLGPHIEETLRTAAPTQGRPYWQPQGAVRWPPFVPC